MKKFLIYVLVLMIVIFCCSCSSKAESARQEKEQVTSKNLGDMVGFCKYIVIPSGIVYIYSYENFSIIPYISEHGYYVVYDNNKYYEVCNGEKSEQEYTLPKIN